MQGGNEKENPKKGGNIVKVEYNGTGMWFLDYPGRERLAIRPGSTVDFNIKDRHELHALLQVIKNMNTRKFNTQAYLVKSDPEPVKYRYRFKVVEGIDNLPEPLRKLHYRENDAPTKEEQDAILSLVPDYYQKEEILYKIAR